MLFVNLPLPNSYSFIVRCRNKTMILTHNIYTQCYIFQAAERYHLKLSMACSNSSRYIPSDPEFIFNYFDNLPSDDLRVTSMVTSTNISARTNIPQQTTTTVFQIKPVLVHSILLPVLHITQPLLVILPPTQLYIHNI